MDKDSISIQDEKIASLRQKVNEAKENRRNALKRSYNSFMKSKVLRTISGKFVFGNWVILLNVLAFFVSWHFNHDFITALFHYFFGVWYLLYCVLTYKFSDGGFIEIINTYF